MSIAEPTTERGVANWFFSGVQKHEKTQFIGKLMKEFPERSEETVTEALLSACQEVKISEGREKLDEVIRGKLG